MSSGGAMPRTDSWVKRLIVAFNSANESPTRRATPIASLAWSTASGRCFSISSCDWRASARASCGDSGRPARAATAPFAEERASSQRPENQQTLERNPSASERSSASSGPSMLSTVSSRPRALSLSASVISSRASPSSATASRPSSTGSSSARSSCSLAAWKAPRPNAASLAASNNS